MYSIKYIVGHWRLSWGLFIGNLVVDAAGQGVTF